ncbi:thymidine phosphorylase [Pelagibius litoralis]|uniref:Thymidine phosphorylase n=1 Tax=Pelagibius litoralis TaxID=374515 RepID=A0A967F0F5_9PROT|nr:thymidine phosphorylase [Pelagibius litoralis]NIA70716.1 thymidine phosphorylase [Pelagibius litoralis]
MGFLPQEIIRRKRDGNGLSEAEIAGFVAGIADRSIGEGQVAAFAMAVFLRGMTREEAVFLTRAMTNSGQQLDWTALDLPGPCLDKHSTGGVGDKVSLILGPLLAACGAFVPMISGRGLGHTGGTLDKLDSIPGYNTAPDIDAFRRVVKTAGCAIIGQTADLAPADRRLYAVRDVTATVESIPLITASILSKKLAAGLQGLVMDVKTGSGAFASTPEEAQALAESIVGVACGAGLPTTALITDMNQPLGTTAGNALEVAESVAMLTTGKGDGRLRDLVLALAVEMLLLGDLAENRAAAEAKVEAALTTGAAAERFAAMVGALGGPADFVERAADYLPKAPVQRPVPAPAAGYLAACDTRAVGLAVIGLGGGRRRVEDSIDHTVGFSGLLPLGTALQAGDPLAIVHARTEEAAADAIAGLQEAFTIGQTEPDAMAAPLVHRRITGDDT